MRIYLGMTSANFYWDDEKQKVIVDQTYDLSIPLNEMQGGMNDREKALALSIRNQGYKWLSNFFMYLRNPDDKSHSEFIGECKR